MGHLEITQVAVLRSNEPEELPAWLCFMALWGRIQIRKTHRPSLRFQEQRLKSAGLGRMSLVTDVSKNGKT